MERAGLAPQNDLVVNPCPTVAGTIEFITVGSDGNLNFWLIDRKLDSSDENHKKHHAPALPAELLGTHWTTATYTDGNVKGYDSVVLILGSIDGHLSAYDPAKEEFVEGGAKRRVRKAQVGCMQVSRGTTVVVASSDGSIYRYPIGGKRGTVLPAEDADSTTVLVKEVCPDLSVAVVSLSMDQGNESGICGTNDGSLHYFTFEDTRPCIPLVRKLSPGLENCNYLRHVPDGTSNVLLAALGEGAGSVKLYTAINLDEIVSFDQKGAR